jgi:hypothetical protein
MRKRTKLSKEEANRIKKRERTFGIADTGRDYLGRLTRYMLACGSIDKIEVGGISITLSDNMGIGYDVKVFDHNLHKRLVWHTYSGPKAHYNAYIGFARAIKRYHFDPTLLNKLKT